MHTAYSLASRIISISPVFNFNSRQKLHVLRQQIIATTRSIILYLITPNSLSSFSPT